MAKVSTTQIDEIIQNSKEPVETVEFRVGDDVITVEIDPNISYADFITAARELAEMQFAIQRRTDAKGNEMTTGEEFYAPYFAEFAKWYVLLKYYTNIDVSISKNESDPEAKAFERFWALRHCGDLRERLYDITKESRRPLVDAANALVEERREQLRPSAFKFWKTLNDLLDEIKQQFDQYSVDDMKALVDGISKLSSIDDGKIIQFMKKEAAEEGNS